MWIPFAIGEMAASSPTVSVSGSTICQPRALNLASVFAGLPRATSHDARLAFPRPGRRHQGLSRFKSGSSASGNREASGKDAGKAARVTVGVGTVAGQEWADVRRPVECMSQATSWLRFRCFLSGLASRTRRRRKESICSALLNCSRRSYAVLHRPKDKIISSKMRHVSKFSWH